MQRQVDHWPGFSFLGTGKQSLRKNWNGRAVPDVRKVMLATKIEPAMAKIL
jgi:hypothetical protein